MAVSHLRSVIVTTSGLLSVRNGRLLVDKHNNEEVNDKAAI